MYYCRIYMEYPEDLGVITGKMINQTQKEWIDNMLNGNFSSSVKMARELFKKIADQTDLIWIRTVSESDFWEIMMDDQTLSQNDGNLTIIFR